MKRELRASQLIGNGGVGAVIDMGDESFVVTDIKGWGKGERIRLPRLSDRLGRELFSPPVTGDGGRGGSVEIKRFPGALFCTACRALIERWNEGRHGRSDGGKPNCPECKAKGSMAPMRFVAACEDGHLDDVHWRRWAHSGRDGSAGGTCTGMWFRVDEKSGVGGLQSLYVECSCGSRRDLETLPAKEAVGRVGQKCRGGHPWHSETTPCDKPLLVLQRGATNLHYAELITALDLGESASSGSGQQGRAAALEDNEDFQFLREFLSEHPTQGSHLNAGAARIAKLVCLQFPELDIEAVVAAARGAVSAVKQEESGSLLLPEQILAEEWDFLTSDVARSLAERTLVSREVPPPRLSGSQHPFSRVLLLERLREVRAMPSFSRIEPGKCKVPVDLGRNAEWAAWYPAIEIYGEGIFLSFDEAYVAHWEARLHKEAPQLVDECAQLERIRQTEQLWFLPEVSPRFIAIHTFSHLLMRQMVFECGYSSSALRERIWANPSRPSAGVLIYTADGDSEGALGGLVRQGNPRRLGDLMLTCLESGAWCSADPVCSETKGQGLGGFNHAACHACSLVPETSCVYANTLLNRLLVVGREGEVPGLMEPV